MRSRKQNLTLRVLDPYPWAADGEHDLRYDSLDLCEGEELEEEDQAGYAHFSHPCPLPSPAPSDATQEVKL